jgi:hypothetical protein
VTADARARERVAAELRFQADWCDALGSPLYATLLSRAADNLSAGGPVWDVLEGRERDRRFSALALRFMAAVHRLVLQGRAPPLGRHYPSAGGDGDAAAAWRPFLQTLRRNRKELRELVRLSCQTNESGRSAALLGGFLLVARETGAPLRLLEVGASAGLNLRWDHFRYEAGRKGWGDRRSPVRIRGVYQDGIPPFDVAAKVVERRGCDLAPIDATQQEGRLRLLSSIWATQPERIEALAAAIEVARRVPAVVDRVSAPGWLRRRLARPTPGVATVVFHSVVLQYLTPAARRGAIAAVTEAGARATAEAPLAWLTMEPGPEETDVKLTTWPGGDTRLIARSGYHGRPVHWLGG